jgi:hypothetical protein
MGVLKMLKREEVMGLLVGMLVVMLITWLTLPTKQELEHNVECIEQCKYKVKKGNTDVAIYSSFTYVRAISACYEACVEEKNESSD